MISGTSGEINNKGLFNQINPNDHIEVLKNTTSPQKKNEYNLLKEGEVFDKSK